MSVHAHGLPLWHGLMAQGLRMAVLLAALTQILHALHWSAMDPLNRHFAGWLMEVRSNYSAMNERPSLAPGDLAIQSLELSAELRAEYLEPLSLDGQALRRLGGVRPIDRDQMAAFLNGLNQCLMAPGTASSDGCLGRESPAARPKVLAIDIDLAPRESDTEDSATVMTNALTALSAHLKLLLIAMPRDEPGAQKRRNEFMRRLCNRPDKSRQDRIAFAAPHLLREADGSVHNYLGREESRADTVYPSLAALIEHNVPKPSQAEGTGVPPKAPANLCHMIPEEGAADPALPLIDHPNLPELMTRYKSELIDWRHMDSPALSFLPLLPPPNQDTDWVASAVQQIRAQGGLTAPVLLLSADGGGAVDRFRAPGSSAPISGAQVHAVQALSVRHPLAEPSWSGLGLDLLMGGLMTLMAASFHAFVLARISAQRWPGLKLLLAAGFTLALAAMAVRAGMELAAWLSHQGSPIWMNPAYLVLGLSLHAYAETQSPHPEPRSPRESWREPLQLLLPPHCRPGRSDTPRACIDRWACWLLQWALLGGAVLAMLTGKH